MWNAKAYKNGPIVPETKERPVNAISKNSIPEYYDFDKEEFLDKFKRHVSIGLIVENWRNDYEEESNVVIMLFPRCR